jgi:hypothetical protein
MCWSQVRNVYLCVSPILALILYFNSPDIRKWWKEDVMKSGTSQSALQPEPPQAQPVEADLPLDSKDAAVACGRVLKLNKVAFERLYLVPRLSQLVSDSGFSEEEVKALGSTQRTLKKQAFSAYSLAYLTWGKPTQTSREDVDKMVIVAAHSAVNENLPSYDRALFDAYMVKFKRMMVKAFDLGRYDARTSPCPVS